LRKQYGIRFIVGWLLVLCLGCGDSEQEVSKKEAKLLTPVSIQLQWVTQAQFAGYYVALEKGWYEQEGLDVTIYPGGPDIVAVDLVTSHARDFGTTLLADLVVSIGQGKKAVSIAQVQQDNGIRLLSKKNSNILTPKDFVGKKVGVWLGGWEVQFNALLAQQQIKPESVERVSQGFSMRPLLDGRLDVASAMIYNEYYMVLAAGLKPDELRIIDYADYGLDFPGDVFFTSLLIQKENPDLCLKMVRASFRGWKYAIANIDEAIEIVLKHDTTGVIVKDHQKKMMAQISMLIKGSGQSKMGTLKSQSFLKMIHFLKKYKMLKTSITENDVYTSEFVNQLTD